MIQKLSISPGQVNDYLCMRIESQGSLNGFSFLSIDRDSYLVGVEVQSGINFDPAGGRHCIAIGKGCSLAESITFMIDLNHDYVSVCQGELPFLDAPCPEERPGRARSSFKRTVLVIPDFSDAYPLYPKILEQYFSENRPNLALLLYLPAEDSTPENLSAIQKILQQHEVCDCDVILQTGQTLEERALFQAADYFVTTRSRETVFRTCLADLFQTKILYGTDEPIFRT